VLPIRDDRRLTPKELENVANTAIAIREALAPLYKEFAKATGAKKGAVTKHINRILEGLLDKKAELSEEDAETVAGVDQKQLEKARDLGKGLLREVLEQAVYGRSPGTRRTPHCVAHPHHRADHPTDQGLLRVGAHLVFAAGARHGPTTVVAGRTPTTELPWRTTGLPGQQGRDPARTLGDGAESSGRFPIVDIALFGRVGDPFVQCPGFAEHGIRADALGGSGRVQPVSQAPCDHR